MAFVLEVTDLQGGVELTSDAKLPTPTLTTITGQNELRVGWSRASGQNPRAFLELRVVQSDPATGVIEFVDIDWGDGESDRFYIGARTIDRRYTHIYTKAATSIEVELSFKPPQDVVFVDSVSAFVQPSADYRIQQVQFEKYEDDVKDLRPDWIDAALVAASFVDGRVRRGFNYKYRVRARSRLIGRADIVTCAFSDVAQAGPWG